MSKESTHPNSRTIVIKSKLPFNHEEQEALKDWFKTSRRSIGSYFKNTSSLQPGSGLEGWEEDILLSKFLGIKEDDPKFKEERDLFYVNMNTKVPYETGIELQIGLKVDNDQPIVFKNEEGKTVNNFPLELEDYLRYRHAIKHPEVAELESQSESIIIKYYVVDSLLKKKLAREAENVSDVALEYWFEVKRIPKDAAMHLMLLGVNYKTIDSADWSATLKDLILNKGKAATFIENYKDTDNNVRFDILRYVKEGIIIREGNRYIFEAEQVGASEKDFIEYLKDENNNETILRIKAKFKELRK